MLFKNHINVFAYHKSFVLVAKVILLAAELKIK